MGVISSTALYLTSSPTAAGGSGSDGPVPVIAFAGDAAMVERPQPVMTIFDLPASARARSLDEAIAREVVRDADAHRETESTAAGEFSTGGDGDGGALDEAVVAAHDARIAALRRRIAASAVDDPAGRRAAVVLALRLHRAEAARRLALARVCGGVGASDGGRYDRAACGSARDGASDHSPEVAQTPPEAARRRHTAALHPSAAQARNAGSVQAVASAHRRHATPVVANVAGARATPGTPSRSARARSWPGGSADARLLAHANADGSIADAATHVRRLLAAARRVLEADAAAPAPSRIELAGLAHWAGSETWSLADLGKRSA